MRTAARVPEAVALEVGGESVTYHRLRDLAEGLAGRIHAEVGRRPRAVGLLAARSLPAYGGYLAALRA